MPRKRSKRKGRRRLTLHDLTLHEMMSLLQGAPLGGRFETDGELRAGWEELRGELMPTAEPDSGKGPYATRPGCWWRWECQDQETAAAVMAREVDEAAALERLGELHDWELERLAERRELRAASHGAGSVAFCWTHRRLRYPDCVDCDEETREGEACHASA